MAATTTAKRLSEAHRLAQARIGAQAVRDLLDVFPLLDVENLDATTVRWLRAAVPIIRARRANSSTLAANYVATFRALELGDKVKPLVPVLAETVTAEQLKTSLIVTGPVALKKAIGRGVLTEQALRAASATSSRAGMRHVLNGGRETTIRTIDSDGIALGWARKTSGTPCAFCAMLASRGPVYRSKAIAQSVAGRSGFDAEERGDDVQARKSGRFTNRLRDSGLVSTQQERGGREIGEAYHDSCHCTAEPIYSPEAEWPEGSRQYADLWFEAKTRAGSGSDDVSDFTAFRQLVEGRRTF